jgi:hypothetical protein
MKWQIKYYIARTGLSGVFMSEVVCTWIITSRNMARRGRNLGLETDYPERGFFRHFLLPTYVNAVVVPQIRLQQLPSTFPIHYSLIILLVII